jgi:iron complex outermembrane receptor protein
MHQRNAAPLYRIAGWVIGHLILAIGALTTSPVHGQSGATLAGTVTSAHDDASIDNAVVTVYLAGSGYALTGTATDAAGRYRLDGLAPGAYRVVVQAHGFRTARHRITLETGQSGALNVMLDIAASGPEAIVTTPSRRPESVQHTPASTTVVGPAALNRSAAPSPVGALQVVPGVNMARTGLGWQRLALRGGSGLSSPNPLVLVDDRPAGLPALGTNVFALMPIPSVDLKRVEVVRGPAAALYGPSADGGVVHFITKNPFDDPGTAVAVAGGSRSFIDGQLRHAAVIGTTFGYEIATYGTRGTNWPFPSGEGSMVFDDPDGALPHQRVDPNTGRLLRSDEYWAAGIYGQATYRLGSRAAVTARGGYASLTGPLLTEWGTLQADRLGYAFAQVQMETGGLLAQAGLNNTQTGTSYLYGTGQRVTNRDVAYDAQLRYQFDKPYWATAFTAGADARWTRPRTGRTLMGRYEEHDALNRHGMYGHANTALATWLDASLAVRADIDNQSRAVWPVVQAALVGDVTPAHTMSLRYARAVASLQAREQFLDVDVLRQTLAGPFGLVYRAQSAAEAFTFTRYRNRREAMSLLPGAGRFGQPLAPSSVPLQPLYETAVAQLEAAWADPADQPAPVQRLSPTQRRTLIEALDGLANAFARDARTEGVLGLPDGYGGYRMVDAPRDVPPLRRPVTQTLEFGYRGRLGERAYIMADAYVGATKNAVRAQMASPFVYAPQLADDLIPMLAPLIAQAAHDPGAPLGALLTAMDLAPSEAAQLTADLVRQAYDAVPVGVVPPDQLLLPAGTSSPQQMVLLTYRNVPRLRYAGLDVGAEVRARKGMRMDAALSIIRAIHSTSATPDGYPGGMLNAPQLSAHVGADWTLGDGWALHTTAHYTAPFSIHSGVHGGSVEASHPLDVGLRYAMQRHVPGLQIHVAVQNVLGHMHRGVVGAPGVGRRAWARIRYVL